MVLTDNLAGYWKCDEASGDLLDAVGSSNGTDTNTVTSAAGKISTARDFTVVNTEYFDLGAPAALESAGGSFEWSCWVNMRSKSSGGGNHTVFGKWGSQNEYFLIWDQSSDRFMFQRKGDQIHADTFGAPSTGTWYHIHCGYNSGTDQIFISVNDGALDTAANTGSPSGGDTLLIGSVVNIWWWDGQLDEIGLWTTRVLTAGERTSLYNAGAGLAYPFSVGADITGTMAATFPPLGAMAAAGGPTITGTLAGVMPHPMAATMRERAASSRRGSGFALLRRFGFGRR